MTPFLAGLGLGLSLIIAIGAQNVFVLRQGIRREHVFVVALICTLSDMTLIVVGISGIGTATQAVPWLVEAVRWVGAVFLVGYGALAAKRVVRPSGEALVADGDADQPEADGSSGSAPTATLAPATAKVVMTCLALTWLNPHVYLDTVFLLGSIGSTHGDGRWLFAAGAMVASTAWFFSLAYGGRLLGRWFSSVAAWRVLDGIIAVIMIGLGVSLVL